jgi:hypothetical protein
MLPFCMTIPATVPQRSEIPEGLMNYPVYKNKCLFFIRTKVDDSIHIRASLATSKCTEKFTLSINNSQPLTLTSG